MTILTEDSLVSLDSFAPVFTYPPLYRRLPSIRQ